MERYSWWAMSYPLGPAGDGNVMQGHADYCAKFGHATYTKNGVIMSWCPRCGDTLPGIPDEPEQGAFLRPGELV